MDLAKCTIDDKTYKAYEFERLDKSELAHKRRFLICKECGAIAFFRKASKSAQAACFGARPHKENCKLAAPENEIVDGTLTKEELAYLNDGNEIVIDFTYGSQVKIHVDNEEEDNSHRESKRGKHSTYNGTKQAKSHKRLSTLLRILIHDNSFFDNSEQDIDLEGFTYKAKNLFKNFADITNEYYESIRQGRRVATWGMISDANDLNDNIWINTGGNDEFSILIEENIKDDFINRFKIKDIEDLAGKYALCIAPLSMSKNEKIYSKINNIGYIVIV